MRLSDDDYDEGGGIRVGPLLHIIMEASTDFKLAHYLAFCNSNSLLTAVALIKAYPAFSKNVRTNSLTMRRLYYTASIGFYSCRP